MSINIDFLGIKYKGICDIYIVDIPGASNEWTDVKHSEQFSDSLKCGCNILYTTRAPSVASK